MLVVLVALYLSCTTAGPCDVRQVVIESGDMRECVRVLKRQRGLKIGCAWRERGQA